MTKICQKCKAENEDGGTFCTLCGAPFDNAPQHATDMANFCERCGANNPSDAVFCCRCGNVFRQLAEIPPASVPAPPSQAPRHEFGVIPPPKKGGQPTQLYVISGVIGVVILLLASLIVTGIPPFSHSAPQPTAVVVTPTPAVTTPTPSADYSSYFTTSGSFENAYTIVTQPFTKSTNERGNDVYTGITTNPSSSVRSITKVEMTQSQAEAKQLYGQTVAQKLSQGFTLRSDWVAQDRVQNPNVPEIWVGEQSSSGLSFMVEYGYDSHIASWILVTSSAGP